MTLKKCLVESTVICLQNGHKRFGNEGDHRDARYADQRLHMQVFVGQRDGVVFRVTEPNWHRAAAEFCVPSAGTAGMLHWLYTSTTHTDNQRIVFHKYRDSRVVC